MKDELRGKEMTELVGARAKTCSYLLLQKDFKSI